MKPLNPCHIFYIKFIENQVKTTLFTITNNCKNKIIIKLHKI